MILKIYIVLLKYMNHLTCRCKYNININKIESLVYREYYFKYFGISKYISYISVGT